MSPVLSQSLNSSHPAISQPPDSSWRQQARGLARQHVERYRIDGALCEVDRRYLLWSSGQLPDCSSDDSALLGWERMYARREAELVGDADFVAWDDLDIARAVQKDFDAGDRRQEELAAAGRRTQRRQVAAFLAAAGFMAILVLLFG